MNRRSDPWQELLSVARRAPHAAEVTERAPLGFATQVVARAYASPDRAWGGLFEQFAWRALGLAAGVAAVSVVWSYAPFAQPKESDLAVEQDPVAIVLDLSR